MLTLPHIRKQGLSTQEWHRHLGPLMLNTHSPLLKHTHRKPLTERPTDGRTSCSGGKKAFLCFEKHHHYITLLHKSHRLCWPLQSAEGGGANVKSLLFSQHPIMFVDSMVSDSCPACAFKLFPLRFLLFLLSDHPHFKFRHSISFP